jgi:hypothetical protein
MQDMSKSIIMILVMVAACFVMQYFASLIGGAR